ncbi:TPA: hypothetical protein JG825_003425 [Vibrio parahaemolyticus]|uniref:hypothetical protein n=1 Tax=Vibrio harveyi group TaxID=717610 RepID=UPI0018F18E91|nr:MULTISPECIES: hypothetical protein [Vibrio harveyi group]MCR9909630.1 hypothetical protein [Vibrio campbellii]UPR19013.1 hypothetical protein H9J99_26055 [Vibrio parahaemolyticus]HAV1520106.1 hypothetical protein [Vibrio parahaemolyticus]HAV1539073.1 hypothetical protein [Vibrio parahaemolyticus]
MGFRRYQAGVIGWFVVSFVAVFMAALLYGTKYLEYKKALNLYQAVSGDMLSIAKSWEEAMNYACVVDNVPLSMVLGDLSLPKSASSSSYGNFTFAYQAPPSLSITISTELTEKGAKVVENRILASVEQYQFGSEVAVATLDGVVTIEVRRVSETSKVIFDRVRGNSQAIQSSMWLGGSQIFDNNGC